MAIADFNRIAAQTHAPDLVVGQGRGNRASIRLQKPLNPPSGWTKFKAELSNLPLLGRASSLQEARAAIHGYPLKLQQYQASNRQILAGFMRDLQNAYGQDVANMAVRGVTVADGAPLTQRTVKTVIDQAKQAQKQCQAMNNMSITRFVENAMQGGARLRGETDMADLFLDRQMPLNGAASWQEAVGEPAARFVTLLTEGECRSLPDHSRQPLTNAQIATAAGHALDVLQELQATAPRMEHGRLDAILTTANGKARYGHELVHNKAREAVVSDHLDRWLDPGKPDSMLRRIADQVTAGMQDEIGALGLPTPPGLDLGGALESLSKSMCEFLPMGLDEMPNQLGCASDLSSILVALQPAVETRVQAGITEHIQALTQIQSSATLTADQKSYLMALAQKRRIDPVQVQAYQAVADANGAALQAMQAFAAGGDAASALGAIDRVLSNFETQVPLMKEHGSAVMWEAGSIDGGDKNNVLSRQFSATAAHALTQAQAQQLLGVLEGPEVSTLIRAMGADPQMRFTPHVSTILDNLIRAVAERSGLPEKVAEARATALTKDPKDFSFADLSPSLALAVLGWGSERIDARGVLADSPNGNLIDAGFTLAGAFDPQTRQHVIDHLKADRINAENGLSATTIMDLPRAAYSINGQWVGAPGMSPDQRVQDYQGYLAGLDAGMRRAVSLCMNQRGIHAFVLSVDTVAYGQGNAVAYRGTTTQHEAWAQPDGSWLVRTTCTNQPRVVETAGNGNIDVTTKGVAAYSITYRVTPGAQPDGEANIQIEDSQVLYAI